MIRRAHKKWVSGLVLGAFALPYASTAHAYNNKTHQNIVNEAWQVMRGAVEPDILAKISWQNGVPAGAKSLAEVGDCGLPASDPRNLCRRQVSQAEWDTFLLSLRTTRQRLNKLKHDIPTANLDTNADCSGFVPLSSDSTVGNVVQPVSQSHMNTSDGRCDARKESPTPGIFFNLGSGLKLPDDFNNSQGLVLGWHAEHRDDDQSDIWIDMMPILVGQVLNKIATIWETVVFTIVAPFVCVWTWLTGGDDCGNKARKFADQTNPADLLKGILPGWRNKGASEESIGLWHFINVQPGNSNWYDDRQGAFYDEAGPYQKPSGIDQSILLAGDLLFLNLDHSHSAGCERYEITEDETSFSHPSDDRAGWSWQSETLGHVQFSPVDNFALYGHQLFEKSVSGARFGAEGLGWPLHAIGDVTVPMHVVSTTGWGHRPYEDFVDRDWGQLMFEFCSQHEPGNCPTNGAATDGLKLGQLDQARRVLQRGFFWHEYLSVHPDLRDFITQIASETFDKVAGEPVFDFAPIGSVWCDACSAGYADSHSDGFDGTIKQATINLYTEQESDAAFDDPLGYYANDPRLFGLAREQLERSSAAALGYLMRIADLSANVCTPLGATCTTPSQCCGEDARCDLGVCARNPPSRCFESTECGRGTCQGGRCCNGLVTQQSCRINDDCCGALCDSGKCCARVNQACHVDRDCCGGGICRGGVCSAGNPGDTCGTDPDCRMGLCVSGHCCGTTGASCYTGPCCGGFSCQNSVCAADTPPPPPPPR